MHKKNDRERCKREQKSVREEYVSVLKQMEGVGGREKFNDLKKQKNAVKYDLRKRKTHLVKGELLDQASK